MGSNFAQDLADMDLSLERSIGIHLSANHYPPVPSSMITPCIEAINAYNEDEYNKLINLPDPITWRGETSAPASAIIEAHHLQAWLWDNEESD